MQVKPLDITLLDELIEYAARYLQEHNISDPEERLNFINSEPAREILKMCYRDTRAYAKFFYPERFKLDFSPLHDEFFYYIDAVNPDGSIKYPKLIVKAFRGMGKTSIAKTIVAKRIRFQDINFATYIGKNEGFAMLQTESIKNGMIVNRLENLFFGKINAKLADIDVTFSKKSWTTTSGTFVLPRGAGQPVRGLLFDWEGVSYRPNLYIIDDLEDKKEIMNETIRNQIYEWILSDVLESKPLPGMKQPYQFVYADTLKHSDAVLQRLIDRGDWEYVDLPICNQDYKSYAPGFVSDEDIKREVEDHRKAGTLDIFYQEKMGMAISTEDAAFRPEYFRYYDEQDSIDGDNAFKEFNKIKWKLETIVIVDPAKTIKVHSAESGFAVISFDIESHKIFIRYAKGLKLYPEEIYEKAIELAKAFNARVIGYEETSLNEFIRKPFVDAVLKAGSHVQLEPLKARSGQGEFSGQGGGKIGRISAMISYYRRGEVYHNQNECGQLESQLLSFPRSKLWDVMDATAYFVELLEHGFRYWTAEESNYYEKPEDIEREYRDLYEDDEQAYDINDLNWQTA